MLFRSAGLRGRDSGERGFLDGGVAVAAVDPDRADVVRVRELHGLIARHVLPGGVRGSLEVVEQPEEDREKEDRPEDRNSGQEVRASMKDLHRPRRKSIRGPGTRNGKREAAVALVFLRESSYSRRVTSLSFLASYYYGFFGYNRRGPQSRAVR